MMEDKAALETKHRGLLMVAVMGVSIIQFLDVTIANVALPHIQSSVGATIETVTWVLTVFIIAGVMVTPILGWLSDRVGSRRLFLWAVSGFLLSSMMCGAATSLTQIVLFRAVQGVCAGIIAPMSQTIMFDINPPSKQANAMSLWGMAVMIAPITGPMLGGWLTDTLNWRWVFYVNLPIGIPTLLILIWLLPSRPVVERKLDIFGFLALGSGLVALQLLLDRGQHKDWFQSWEIMLELLFALSAFWVFWVHSISTKHPLFPRELMQNTQFLGAVVFMFVLGLANVAIASILPTMYQNVYGYSAFDTGMLLMPRGLGVMVTMTLCSRLMKYVDIRYLIICGYSIAGSALFLMSQWSLDIDRWPILATGFLQGLGLGCIFMPMNVAAFGTLAPQHRPDGSSLLNLMRNLGGSFGISVMITMLSRNTQVSHSDLAAHITTNSLPIGDPVGLSARFGEFGTSILQMVDLEINRQALFIAYMDNFYMMGFFIISVAIIPFFLKPIRFSNGKQVPVSAE